MSVTGQTQPVKGKPASGRLVVATAAFSSGTNRLGLILPPSAAFTMFFHEVVLTREPLYLTRKAKAEIQAAQDEQALRNTIINRCADYGFDCRFLYESVIITTPISSWQFGYHESRKTLRHENSIHKINFETGNYVKTHEQFRDRKMSCTEIIDYIAAHDKWRQEQINLSEGNGS